MSSKNFLMDPIVERIGTAMSILETRPAEGFECLSLGGASYETFITFDGHPRNENWNPIAVQRLRPFETSECKPSDSPLADRPSSCHAQSAVDAVRDILNSHGEILPLASGDRVELFVFNAIVIDALDEAHSVIVRFPNSDRIMAIEKAAFRSSAVHNTDIFRLRHGSSPTYVSERFVNRVDAAKLQGLRFRKSRRFRSQTRTIGSYGNSVPVLEVR